MHEARYTATMWPRPTDLGDDSGPESAAHSTRSDDPATSLETSLRLILNCLNTAGWPRTLLAVYAVDGSDPILLTTGFEPGEAEALSGFVADAMPASLRNGRGANGDAPLAAGDRYQPATAAIKGLTFTSIVDDSNQTLGLLGAGCQVETAGTPPQPALLASYVALAAALISNHHTTQQANTRMQEMAAQLEASQALSGLLDKEAVLQTAGTWMSRAVHASGYLAVERRRDAGSVLLVAAANFDLPVSAELVPGQSWMLAGYPSVQALLEDDNETILVLDRVVLESARPWTAPEGTHACVLVPIRLSDETFGLIELHLTAEHEVTAAEAAQLSALAELTASALESALVFEDVYERERFYSALGRVSLAMNSTLDRESVLDLIGSESRRIFDVDGAYIWQREGDLLMGVTASGTGDLAFNGSVVPLSDTESLIGRIANRNEALFLNDLSHHQQAMLHLPHEARALSVIGVPFESDGRVAGVLLLADTRNRARFDQLDLNKASIFGGQVGLALQNARLFDDLRHFNEELDLRVADRTLALNEESNRVKVLLRITSELSSSLDQDRVLGLALQLLNESVQASDGAIMLLNQAGDQFDVGAVLQDGSATTRLPDEDTARQHAKLSHWLLENRKTLLITDATQDDQWPDLFPRFGCRSLMGVPLISGEEVIGALMLYHTRPFAFSKQQLDLVEAAAIQVANAISNANLYLLIRDQAESLGTMLLTEQIEAAKSQSILESIADGVIVADGSNRILLANLAATRILGTQRSALVGGSVSETLGQFDDTGDSWVEAVRGWADNADMIETGAFLADEFTVGDRVVSVHLSPVLVGRQFFAAVYVLRDITESVEVDRLKSEFVSTVSHELRTPMTSIKGYVDLLLMGVGGTLSEPQTKYLGVIKNSAERLHLLVNDLLDISRIETGRTTLVLQPIDMRVLVKQVVNGHLHGRRQHSGKQVEIGMTFEPDLPLVNADQARITQVLTNLLDNAFNYTPQGGRIDVAVEAEEASIRVSVSDTGIGIAEDIQARIFDRFFRSEDDAVQSVPGTGLGLAIVSSLIEMHGGRLGLRSTPGIGSTFSFTLPGIVENEELN